MPTANARVITEPTELLITAYDGAKALFATCLTPGKASTVITAFGDDAAATVGAVVERETRIFESVTQMLVDLATPVNVA